MEARINVIDENDQTPIFSGFTGCCYRGSISENATSGTEVIKVNALDSDYETAYKTVSIIKFFLNLSFAHKKILI